MSGVSRQTIPYVYSCDSPQLVLGPAEHIDNGRSYVFASSTLQMIAAYRWSSSFQRCFESGTHDSCPKKPQGPSTAANSENNVASKQAFYMTRACGSPTICTVNDWEDFGDLTVDIDIRRIQAHGEETIQLELLPTYDTR